jgi:hypothetical protein
MPDLTVTFGLADAVSARARALIEFIAFKSKKGDKRHWSDLLPDWRPGPAAAVAHLHIAYKTFSEHLAHIVEEPGGHYNFDVSVVDHIMTVFEQFGTDLTGAGSPYAEMVGAQVRHSRMMRGAPRVVLLGENPGPLDAARVAADWERAMRDPNWQ